MTLFRTISEKLQGCSAKLRTSFLVTLVAILIHNFPWMLNWLPVDLRSTAQTGAYMILQASVLAALLWAKQHNVIGDPSAVTVPPQAPVASGLVGTAGDTQVLLKWATTAGAASYNVKRSLTRHGPYAVIASDVSVGSYTDTGLTNGTIYYYVISAVNTMGESANSAEVVVTPSSTSSITTSSTPTPTSASTSITKP